MSQEHQLFGPEPQVSGPSPQANSLDLRSAREAGGVKYSPCEGVCAQAQERRERLKIALCGWGGLGPSQTSSQHFPSGFPWSLRNIQGAAEEEFLVFTSQSAWSEPGGGDIRSQWVAPGEGQSPHPLRGEKGLRVSVGVLRAGCGPPSWL